MFTRILAHLTLIAESLKNDEVIPISFLSDIFSGITLNHNDAFLVDDGE